MEFKVRNVNEAFETLVRGIHGGTITTIKSHSRVGDVLQVTEPVMVTYTNPTERVLFNRKRDANPFFHLYEALWMLAGRNDVAPLAYYNGKIANIASDDGETFNGAYGYRWRTFQAWDMESGCWQIVDQLEVIADHLKNKPNSRRAVLQMWNVEDDLLNVETTKDTCCNLSAMFSIRAIPDGNETGTGPGSLLDMTVCNRSNDLIWGMLGANVVHFSILQEYMAAKIGVNVGVYRQFTNNLHVYMDNWKPREWLSEYSQDMYTPPSVYENRNRKALHPVVERPDLFDEECADFVDNHCGNHNKILDIPAGRYQEPFLREVAQPMAYAFALHRMRQYESALEMVQTVESDDWKTAATDWLKKRKEKWERKHGTKP